LLVLIPFGPLSVATGVRGVFGDLSITTLVCSAAPSSGA